MGRLRRPLWNALQDCPSAGRGRSLTLSHHPFPAQLLALLNGTLVSEASLDVMWRRYGEGDGYGFQVHQRPIGLAVGHTGGSWGASSQLTIYPDAGYIVAALANYRTAAAPLVERIEQLIERTAR
jgi:hypothetical protein